MSSPSIRELCEADFAVVRERVDLWWGRPVQGALLRLFFEHFLPMSRAAEADGELVGFIVGFQSQTQPSVAYVHFIAVDPEHRHRGLARTLYELFFEAARARGCGVVEAITAPINVGSIAFHRRLGFELLPSSTLVEGVPVSVDHDGPGQHRVRFRRSV
jgi:ribosomal protein S18 acetylase RimI-like enzyme